MGTALRTTPDRPHGYRCRSRRDAHCTEVSRCSPGGRCIYAHEWYDSALDLEVISADQAMGAYRAALALDANLSEAQVNLGRLLHEVGRVE